MFAIIGHPGVAKEVREVNIKSEYLSLRNSVPERYRATTVINAALDIVWVVILRASRNSQTVPFPRCPF